MKRCRISLEEKTKTISGKDLSEFLGVKPGDYNILYPNKPRDGGINYCPCIDIAIGGECHGMVTVMDALTRNEIKEFPQGTTNVSEGKYQSGDVWIDKSCDIAYLIIGQSPAGRDVVLNLGGDTYNKGNIELGLIAKKDMSVLFLEKKVFPR